MEYLGKGKLSMNIIELDGISGLYLALDMHASGYVLKPVTPERIKLEMRHLRQPEAYGSTRSLFTIHQELPSMGGNNAVYYR